MDAALERAFAQVDFHAWLLNLRRIRQAGDDTGIRFIEMNDAVGRYGFVILTDTVTDNGYGFAGKVRQGNRIAAARDVTVGVFVRRVAHDAKMLDIAFGLPVDGPFDNGVEFVVLVARNRADPLVFPVGHEMGPGKYFLFADHRKSQQDAVVADEEQGRVRFLAIRRGKQFMVLYQVSGQDIQFVAVVVVRLILIAQVPDGRA